ncbi:hypothetical protein DFH09DRAFT_1282503 [Mycena vulgaris]|nr:hypothetical protein DFH09DRAFT_1282503 [Mycena vulgaris]
MAGSTQKPKRAAMTTSKAKKAAAIAAAKSKETEAPRKRRGRPPKNKTVIPDAQEDLGPGEGGDGGTPEDGKEGGAVIDWTPELTWSLVTAMEEDEAIRRGLFPPPGSVKRSGAQPKKHFQWLLAQTLFAQHPQYAEAFSKALMGKAKDQKPWWCKIKNRVKILTDEARAHIDTMGQTGAGLEDADKIIEGTELHTKWDEIKESCPWFFEMRSLIGERPNLRPVGIGNNDSDIDTSLLLRGDDQDDQDHNASTPDDTSDFPDRLASLVGTDTDHDMYDPKSDGDSDDDVSVKRGKRKRTRSPTAAPTVPKAPPKKRTQPQAAISTPAPATSATAKPTKPTTAKEKFSAVILAEEATAQQALGLKKDRNRARKDIELARIQAGAQVQVEKAKSKTQEKLAKIELAKLRMQQEHELRMAQMQSSSSSHRGPSSMGSSSFFDNDDTFSFHGLPAIPSSDAGSSSATTPFALDNNLRLPHGHF